MNGKFSRRNCKRYREMVSLFIDTELEQENEHAMLRHLAGCEECQSYLDVMMKFKVVKQHDQVEYPSELDSSIFEELKIRKNVYALGKIDPQPVHLPLWKRRIAVSMPLAAAFVFAVLLGLGSIIYSIEGPAGPVRQSIVAMFQGRPRIEVRDQFIYPMPMQTVVAGKEQLHGTQNM
jgi:hypothetical protein